MKIGDKVKMLKTIPTANGTLYQGDRGKIDEILMLGKLRITDAMGRIWYVNKSDVQVI